MIRLYESGERFMTLCRKYGIGTSALARMLKGRTQYALGKKDIRRKLTVTQEQECLLAYNAGATCESLGETYKCHEATIRATLYRLGVRMRDRGPQYQSERTKAIISRKSKEQWASRE